MKSKRNLIIVLILLIGLIGITIAYFTNVIDIDNIFSTKSYGNTITEEFISPDNWLPGDITEKSIIATNTGSVDQAVRIKLNESWTPYNTGSTLNGWIHEDGTKSTHETEEELENDERVAIINFDNSSDWTYSNGYYYYNYKLSPNESTSSLIKSVTFNSKTKLDDTCEETLTSTGKTITCESSGNDYDNATYTLTFNIETVQYNKYQEVWGNNVSIAEEKLSSGVDYLMSNAINADGAEYNATTKSKMFKMSHPATAQTPAQTEYRYIGDNPNNYVYFNCNNLDNQNSDTCEVWRIIGVFDVDDGSGNYEQRIKLVRGSALPDTKDWDSSGLNDWTNASLKTYLNEGGDYYNRTGSALNIGLKSTVKNMIANAKYYLGGATYNNESGFGTADAIYLWERGTEVYNFENYCLYNTLNPNCSIENYCENNPTVELCNTGMTSWVGKIALMYPSDHYLVYANGVDARCYGEPDKCEIGESSSYGSPNSGWIYNSNNLENKNTNNRTLYLSSNSSIYSFVFDVYEIGSLHNYGGYGEAVRPVLYLSSNVKITDGTGEQNNPYKLGL